MGKARVWSAVLALVLSGCGSDSGSSTDGPQNNNDGSGIDAPTTGDGGPTVTTVATIPLPGKPNGSAVFDPATNLIYVGMYNDGSTVTSAGIAVIDTTVNQIKTTISTTAIVGGLALNPTTHKIYAAASSFSGPSMPTVYVIDATNQTITATINPGSAGQISAAVAVHPTTNKIYVLNTDFAAQGGKIAVVDGTNNTVTATITVPMTTFGSGSAAIQPGMNKLFAVGQKYNDPANVIANVIDTTTNTVTSSTTYAGTFVNVSEGGNSSAIVGLNGSPAEIDVLDPCKVQLPAGAYLRHVTNFFTLGALATSSTSVIYCKDGFEWVRNVDLEDCTTEYDIMTDQPCPHAYSDDPASCPATMVLSYAGSGGNCINGYYLGCDSTPCMHGFSMCR